MATRGLGDPNDIMAPDRLAMLPPTRLSASRALVNKMIRERWNVGLRRINLDDKANGEAVYRVTAGGRSFEFVVFSAEPAPGRRSGRIIASGWDMTGALIEGTASAADVAAARRELLKVYAGRAGPGTLIWCRSNRSARGFDHTVRTLAAGRQPDVRTLAPVGYLMRIAALEGNGRFGTRPYCSLEDDHPLRAPYHAQMLAAYLIREFSFDLVHHLASSASSRAATIAPALRRYLGVGNASGLGLVFFVNNHPMLISHWLSLRGSALQHALATEIRPGSAEISRLAELIDRAVTYHSQDRSAPTAFAAPADIAAGLRLARDQLARCAGRPAGSPPSRLGDVIEALCRGIGPGAAEVLRSLAIELVPAQADKIAAAGSCAEILQRAPDMLLGELREIINSEYGWALATDLTASGARANIWYRSRDAEEPRRGPRREVAGGYDWTLDVPGDLQRIMRESAGARHDLTVGEFCASHPHDRAAIARVQGLHGLPYHSPHVNMAADDFVPAQVIRLVNAAFHGLDRTVNYLDRAVLGLVFQGAPTRGDLDAGWAGDWFWPPEPTV
jgi:hypothetical protein